MLKVGKSKKVRCEETAYGRFKVSEVRLGIDKNVRSHLYRRFNEKKHGRAEARPSSNPLLGSSMFDVECFRQPTNSTLSSNVCFEIQFHVMVGSSHLLV